MVAWCFSATKLCNKKLAPLTIVCHVSFERCLCWIKTGESDFHKPGGRSLAGLPFNKRWSRDVGEFDLRSCCGRRAFMTSVTKKPANDFTHVLVVGVVGWTCLNSRSVQNVTTFSYFYFVLCLIW